MAGATVLLTGGTGFLGKVVLEALLRRRQALGVERVLALVRAEDADAARARLEREVFASPCLAGVREAARSRVEALAGDVARPGCGVAEPPALEPVTHVLHCAASVEFELPLARAAAINLEGSLHALELARACPALRALVSVSTAYAAAPASEGRPVPEALAPLPRPARAIHAAVREGRADERALLAETGHPNTYTLTKCLAEHRLVESVAEADDVPLAIVRPSIISACRRHPFPGWIDSHAAFAAFIALVGSGYLRTVAARPEVRLDVVPCDDVAERVVDAALLRPPERGGAPAIRHAVAGLERGISIAETRDAIERHFGPRRPGAGPRLVRVGPVGPAFHATEWAFQRAPLGAARAALALRGDRRARRVARLEARLRSVNRVFPWFTHREHAFRTSAPLEDFEPRDYLDRVCEGVHAHLLGAPADERPVAGREAGGPRSHLGLALRQPKGGLAHRAASLALGGILRRATSRVSVDEPAFEAALAAAPPGRPLVLAASHRSYLDFLVLPYVLFARPDLGVPLPHIAADVQFARIPLLSRLARRCGAFFLERGRGAADKALTREIHRLAEARRAILFFIEGGRSRTREMQPPRRGLLRALQSTGRGFTVLPVSITYDRVAEEASFAKELAGGPRPPIRLGALARWLARVRRGEIDLGRVHLSCGGPVALDLSSDVREVAGRVAGEIQESMATTQHHLRCFLARHPVEGVDADWLAERLRRRGARVLESRRGGEAELPEAVERMLRAPWAHRLAPELARARPDDPAVRAWLDRAVHTSRRTPSPDAQDDPRLAAVLAILAEGLRSAPEAPLERAYSEPAISSGL